MARSLLNADEFAGVQGFLYTALVWSDLVVSEQDSDVVRNVVCNLVNDPVLQLFDKRDEKGRRDDRLLMMIPCIIRRIERTEVERERGGLDEDALRTKICDCLSDFLETDASYAVRSVVNRYLRWHPSGDGPDIQDLQKRIVEAAYVDSDYLTADTKHALLFGALSSFLQCLRHFPPPSIADQVEMHTAIKNLAHSQREAKFCNAVQLVAKVYMEYLHVSRVSPQQRCLADSLHVKDKVNGSALLHSAQAEQLIQLTNTVIRTAQHLWDLFVEHIIEAELLASASTDGSLTTPVKNVLRKYLPPFEVCLSRPMGTTTNPKDKLLEFVDRDLPFQYPWMDRVGKLIHQVLAASPPMST
jgi:hypothetical protein